MPARQAHTTKRRRLSPTTDPVNHDEEPIDDEALTPDFYNRISEWDLEAQYDSLVHKKAKKQASEGLRLPIKTMKGDIKPVTSEEKANDGGSSSSSEEEGSPETERPKEKKSGAAKAEEQEQQPKMSLKDQVITTKEQLARVAENINEDPELNVSQLRQVLQKVTSKQSHNVIKKLVLAALAAIYKDVIPGYRIRPLTDADKNAKVSKDIRKLRDFEQSLLSCYQKYVQELAKLAKGNKGETKDVRNGGSHDYDDGLKFVAVSCACNLLLSVPHFNFRLELLKVLVDQLSHRQVTKEHIKSRETIEQIFANDDDGVVSMETVSLLSKMMKARKFAIHDSVLDTFLHLRLLSELSVKGSNEKTEAVDDQNGPQSKKAKQKKVFRTKKERKLLKAKKSVEKDMKEADALVSHEQRDQMQAETLKLVFGVYFRILKLHVPNLIGAVLEGLAKYAHLTNQDFFGDLLEALRELVEQGSAPVEADEEEESKVSSTRNSTRQTLLCAITAFALLEGQDASKAAPSLHLDLSFFINHIYQTLYSSSLNPDIEYHPTKSLRLPDPTEGGSNDNKNNTNIDTQQYKVNFKTPTVLLLRCLQSILLTKGIQAPPPIRVAAFAKRLMTITLQLPEKSATAVLSLLSQVSKQHGRKIAPLWYSEERKGDGVYHGNAITAETSNVFATTMWENELLKQHYCPQVRDLAMGVEGMIKAV